MEDIRFVPAFLKIVYEPGNVENTAFMQEYYTLLQLNDDPLGLWLKSSKVRKESEQSDQVLLTLLVELHRKIDKLTHLITSDTPLHLPLALEGNLKAIGHGYIEFDSNVLKPDENYYARIDMPTFPKRQMPLFFEALNESIGKIVMMHEDDEKDWSTYMVACERVMIRQMKGNQNEY
ncbi:hypothetical protein SJPD1_0188 [Sulfurospirillum diekertiae]|uniref:Uncharacterized protein n=1 Tax=Sulfurospirillum diekertiae TaxID=1854492 RepID=A0A290HA21_9BACT|nr:hypothetical protein [Sulfurospirillum diekertiae]ATB68317.1 hypothetical protein SJPD1_0188 [Sulfurospirillum diekertiae]